MQTYPTQPQAPSADASQSYTERRVVTTAVSATYRTLYAGMPAHFHHHAARGAARTVLGPCLASLEMGS